MENRILAKLTIKGNWNALKGKLKQKYSQLADDDLLYIVGKENELVSRLEKRLGKTAEQVIDIVEELQIEITQIQSEQIRKANQEEANRPKMTEPVTGQQQTNTGTKSNKMSDQEIGERAETGQPKIPDLESLETEESPETDKE